MVAIYRKKTHIGPGGKEVESRMKYFVVDSVEALAKFGGDPWCVRRVSLRECSARAQGPGGVRDDDGSGVAVSTVQMERAAAALSQRCGVA